MPTLSEKRLAQLLEKERAHDDYLAATKAVRAHRARLELSSASAEFMMGYGQALTDFATAIVDAANARSDADGDY
jgi:hypothetical protein